MQRQEALTSEFRVGISALRALCVGRLGVFGRMQVGATRKQAAQTTDVSPLAMPKGQ